MKVKIHHKSPIPGTYRAALVSSLFNVAGDADFRTWVDAPIEDRPWKIGLICGASGSGKSSIARTLFGRKNFHNRRWPPGAAIIDAIAPESDARTVTAALSAVGLGTVPAWLREARVLSTGERFRADLARILCERPELVVVDEFTSAIDRQVATIAAGAFAKAWRREHAGKFVAVSCHRDVLEWLQPDWVVDTDRGEFQWRNLQRRPSISVDIHQVDGSWWRLFEPHHYLKLPRMVAAFYYVAFAGAKPVAHVAFSTLAGLREARACRLVVLPEWQGAGIGIRFLNEVSALWRRGINHYGKPMPTIFHTSHPGLAAALRRDPVWAQVSARLYGVHRGKCRASMKNRVPDSGGYGGHFRAVQGFRYVE